MRIYIEGYTLTNGWKVFGAQGHYRLDRGNGFEDITEEELDEINQEFPIVSGGGFPRDFENPPVTEQDKEIHVYAAERIMKLV